MRMKKKSNFLAKNKDRREQENITLNINKILNTIITFEFPFIIKPSLNHR